MEKMAQKWTTLQKGNKNYQVRAFFFLFGMMTNEQ